MKKMFGSIIIFIILNFLFLSAAHSEPWITEITIPLLTQKEVPKIDGVIDEREWSGASSAIGAFKDERNLDGREYTAWLTATADTLYLAIKTRTEDNAELFAKIQPEAGIDQIKAFYDDSFELWIAPDKEDQSRRCYQIIVNSLGAKYDVYLNPSDTSGKKDESYQINWNYVSKVKDGEWQAEIAIPLDQIQADINKPLGLRLVRNWQNPLKQVDWSPFLGAFNIVSTMGTVRFDTGAPVVRQLSLRTKDRAGADIRFEIKNPGKKEIAIAVETYSLVGEGNQETNYKNEYVLKPGQRKIVVVDKGRISGIYKNFIKVTSMDAKTVYYARKFFWLCAKEEEDAATGLANDFPLHFAYYPSFNKFKAKIDIRKLEGKEQASGALLRIKNKKTGKVVFKSKMPAFKKFISETLIDIPRFAEGEYLLEAHLTGVDNAVSAGQFIRKVYEWEDNTIGISDEVIPPYTPLVLKGRSVSAVLRKYTLNKLGLPEQVISEGKPLLAGPVSMNIKVAGRKQKIKVVKVLSFSKVKPNEIQYVSEWKAGPLRVKIKGYFDYDGMLKIEMQFEMKNDAVLEKMDLLIPYDPGTATLMHVISDRARYSFIGNLPEGDGRIWKSSQLDRNDMPDPDYVVPNLPGNFVPYIWLGNERRGLCWFADNDKDWLFDDNKSTHIVYRKKDRILVKVGFVKAPAALKKVHKIVFGLQATPTKPMPEKPDHWRRTVFSLTTPEFSDLLNINILGSAWQWGGGNLFAFYPRNKDFNLYKIMKNTRAGNYQEEEWDKWIDGYDPENPFFERMKRNMNTGKHIVKSKPDVIIPYCNARGVPVTGEEFKTFQDEWLIYKYTTRKWPKYDDGRLGYVASVVKSRQDFILYCFNKMLDSGAFDSIYFDCTYLKAVRDPISTSAYIDDNGNMRAGSELFALRDLFKRCAVLCYQKRGFNFNVAHMTTALAAPLHTWFGVTLDWEHHYGLDDFQDRFSRDHTRATALGSQTGCVPLVLGSIGIRGENSQQKKPWALRTLAGCILVHEIKDWAVGWGRDKTYKDALKLLYDFGYGNKECAVYNYWDENYPAVIEGIESGSLLLSKDGEVLMVVTDYGNGGKCKLTIDAGTLKIKGGRKFYNAETGEEMESTETHSCSFTLKKHDFIIVRYK